MEILSVIGERNVVFYNQGSWGSTGSNSKPVVELVGNTLVSIFLIQEFSHQMILPPGSASGTDHVVLAQGKHVANRVTL